MILDFCQHLDLDHISGIKNGQREGNNYFKRGRTIGNTLNHSVVTVWINTRMINLSFNLKYSMIDHELINTVQALIIDDDDDDLTLDSSDRSILTNVDCIVDCK